MFILYSNYHDINYGFETKLMQMLFAEFYIHQCSGKIRRRFHSRFRSLCPIVFPPATRSHTKIFPLVTMHKQQCQLHCSLGNSAFRRYQPRMLPGASDVTLVHTRTASSRVLLLLFPASGILLPRSCLRCAGFRTFLSAANTLWNAVSAFVVVTSVCRIIGVILLSLFSVTLSLVGSVTETSSERTVLRSGHFVYVKEIPRTYAS